MSYSKEKKYASQAAHRERNKQKLYEYLIEHPCIDCGEDDLRCLHFDHLRDKKFNISKAVHGSTRSWESILKEIEKCEVRCANCHSKKHHNDTYLWLRGRMD